MEKPNPIKAMNPQDIAVIASFQGTIQEEKVIHRRFAHLRVRGEWFRYEGALKEYVEALVK